jgi:hypothetical protein
MGGSKLSRACSAQFEERHMQMDSIFVLAIVNFGFGGFAAALAWAEYQNLRLNK